MKVVQVLNHFFPQQVAGTEVYTWALSKKMLEKGINVQIVIPHFGNTEFIEYDFDGLSVLKYPETSFVDRSLIMGFREPDGLSHFVSHLKEAQPDIVHFHELTGSNGISLQHVQAAKATGAKVIMTFHLAGYSCKTGTLVYKGEQICDGEINLQKCSFCYLHSRGYANEAMILVTASSLLHQFSIDTSKCNHKLGTALATVPIIAKFKKDLNILVAACDVVVAITQWYQKILYLNGVEQKKIKYIPQGLPLNNTPFSNKKIFSKKPLRLLFLGRISKFKGLHLLLDAIKNIDTKLVELSIYGISNEDLYYKQLLELTKKKSNVLWRGKLDQEDVLKTMQEHDVLCLCSTFSEMSPLVIQEAFEAQIPVIASNVYGNSEQINHGINGLLFKFNDVSDLRTQIVRCINDPYLLENMIKNIQKPRSFEDVSNDYYELYKSLLS